MANSREILVQIWHKGVSLYILYFSVTYVSILFWSDPSQHIPFVNVSPTSHPTGVPQMFHPQKNQKLKTFKDFNDPDFQSPASRPRPHFHPHDSLPCLHPRLTWHFQRPASRHTSTHIWSNIPTPIQSAPIAYRHKKAPPWPGTRATRSNIWQI